MAREIKLDVIVDDHGAIDTLKRVDDAANKTTDRLKNVASALNEGEISASDFVKGLDKTDAGLRNTTKSTEAFGQAQRQASQFSKVLESDMEAETAASSRLRGELAQQAALIKQLAGTDLTTKAEQWATAIQEVGGVTALTRREQQQANAIFSETVEKYNAMGQVVPPHIQSLKDQTTTTSLLSGATTALVTAVGSYLTVRGIYGAIAASADYAANLQRQSEQTGLSVEAFQELSYAAGQSNVSLAMVTQGISVMEAKLASGDSSLANGLRIAKIGFEELRGLTPEETFSKIARAIDAIGDQNKKLEALRDIFGPSGIKLAPFLKDLDEVRQKAQDVGAVMDDKTIAALNRLNNSIDTAKTKFKVWIGEGLVPAIDKLEQLQDIASRVPTNSGGGLMGLMKRILEMNPTAFHPEAIPGMIGGGIDAIDTLTGGAGVPLPAPKSPGLPGMPGIGLGGPDPNTPAGLLEIQHIEEQSLNLRRELTKASQQEAEALKALAHAQLETMSLDRQMNRELTERLNITKGVVGEILKQSGIRSQNEIAGRSVASDPIQAAAETRDRQLADLNSRQARMPGVDMSPEYQKIQAEFQATVDAIIFGGQKISTSLGSVADATDAGGARVSQALTAFATGLQMPTGGTMPGGKSVSLSEALQPTNKFYSAGGYAAANAGTGGMFFGKGGGGGDTVNVTVNANNAQFQDERSIDRLADQVASRIGQRAGKSVR